MAKKRLHSIQILYMVAKYGTEFVLFVDHAISTGRRITNLMLNFERLIFFSADL